MFAAALLSTATASADTFSGNQCTVNSANQTAAYNFFGIHNEGSSALETLCPAATRTAVHSVAITTYDRSPTDDVRCLVAVTNSAGQFLFSASPATTGFGTTPITLTSSVPSISGALVMRCSIPAANAQNGFSHVTSYSVL